MKKVFTFILSLFLILPAAFLLASCGEFKISADITATETIGSIVDHIMMGPNQANNTSAPYVWESEDSSYKNKTVTFSVIFKGGKEPDNPTVKVNGESITNFTINTNENYEFEKSLDFTLPCQEDSHFEVSLDAAGVKTFSKSYLIDINVPSDQTTGNPITEDYYKTGVNYLEAISIMAYKGNETTPKYYTLKDIAQLDKDAGQPKDHYRAYMEVKSYNGDALVFFVKAPTQYYTTQNNEFRNSVIDKIFKVGNFDLSINLNWWDSPYAEETNNDLLTGNLLLGIEYARDASGYDTLSIDTTPLTQAFTQKTYHIDRSRSEEFDDIQFQGISGNSSHTYGEETEYTFIPVLPSSASYKAENVDLTNAKVFVNGVELNSEQYEIIDDQESGVQKVKVTFDKATTADRINGQQAVEPSDNLVISVKNISFRGIDQNKLVVLEFPYLGNAYTIWTERNFHDSSIFNDDTCIGSLVTNNSVKLTFLMEDAEIPQGVNYNLSFQCQEFGYKTFKLKLTTPNGNTYTTDEINLLEVSTDPIAFKDSNAEISHAHLRFLADEYGNPTLIFGLEDDSDRFTMWNQLSGYKIEYVETTQYTDSIKLKFDFDIKNDYSYEYTFKIADKDTTFAKETDLQSPVVTYALTAYILNIPFNSVPSENRVLKFKFLDSEGNELEPLGDFGLVSINNNQIEEDGLLNLNFYIRSNSRIGQIRDTQERKLISELVFYFEQA